MNTQIIRTPMAKFEAILITFAKAIWDKDCVVVYQGESHSQLKDIKWLSFDSEQGEFSLHIAENNTDSSILTLMNYVSRADESGVDFGSVVFSSITSSQQKIYYYTIYDSATCSHSKREPIATFFVGHGSYHEELKNSDNAYLSEYSKLLSVPFSISLTIPDRVLYSSDKFVCSQGRIHYSGLREDLQTYTYFSKGGLEMSIQDNENTEEKRKSSPSVPVEFVLDGFEMSFEEALSLRPGDRIEIDTPQQLQGVIRIAGGDWVSASLTLKEGQAILSVEKMIDKETLETSER